MDRNKKARGFIVHPWESLEGGYDASYGPNHDKTIKFGFKTLGEAKAYLHKKGINEAVYDRPGGTRVVRTGSRKVTKKGSGNLFSRLGLI